MPSRLGSRDDGQGSRAEARDAPRAGEGAEQGGALFSGAERDTTAGAVPHRTVVPKVNMVTSNTTGPKSTMSPSTTMTSLRVTSHGAQRCSRIAPPPPCPAISLLILVSLLLSLNAPPYVDPSPSSFESWQRRV